MLTTNQLLDRIKSSHQAPSDYRLAKIVGIDQSGIRNYRSGRSRPDDVIASRLAVLADLDPGYVVACIHAERAQDDQTRTLWTGIADRLQRSGLAALAALCFALPSDPASARTPLSQGIATAPNCVSVYYVKSKGDLI